MSKVNKPYADGSFSFTFEFEFFQIINPSEDYLEKLLLIPHWNYVPSSSSSAVKEGEVFHEANQYGQIYLHVADHVFYG